MSLGQVRSDGWREEKEVEEEVEEKEEEEEEGENGWVEKKRVRRNRG